MSGHLIFNCLQQQLTMTKTTIKWTFDRFFNPRPESGTYTRTWVKFSCESRVIVEPSCGVIRLVFDPPFPPALPVTPHSCTHCPQRSGSFQVQLSQRGGRCSSNSHDNSISSTQHGHNAFKQHSEFLTGKVQFESLSKVNTNFYFCVNSLAPPLFSP